MIRLTHRRENRPDDDGVTLQCGVVHPVCESPQRGFDHLGHPLGDRIHCGRATGKDRDVVCAREHSDPRTAVGDRREGCRTRAGRKG